MVRGKLAPPPELSNTKAIRIGILLGIGVVGSLDQIILHELLQWHTYYIHTTQQGRIFIDGLFHLVTASLLFWGAIQLWQNRAAIRKARQRAFASGIFLGMGGFNLFDGIVNHKILGLHPVREGVANILPYDLAFNGIAVILLVIGYMLWRGVEARPVRV